MGPGFRRGDGGSPTRPHLTRINIPPAPRSILRRQTASAAGNPQR